MSLTDAVGDWMRSKFSDKTMWDEPPQLLFLYNVKGAIHNGNSVIPDRVWDLARPPEILWNLSQAFSYEEKQKAAELAEMRPESLCGVAFICEGWTVDLPESQDRFDEALKEELMEQSGEHKIYTRQDKREMVFIGVHTTEGPDYAQMIRGQEPDFLLRDHGAAEMQGVVPESLERLYRMLVTGEELHSE